VPAVVIRRDADGRLFSIQTQAHICRKIWLLHRQFSFILKLAAVGEWPGNPHGTTAFPQKTVIEDVRICEP
jgi:hypothetical protein